MKVIWKERVSIKKISEFFWQIFGHYSWIPLLAIFVHGLHQIYFLIRLKNAPVNVVYVSAIWVALQCIFATLFGLISDKYCRKKTLVFTLGCSMLSLPLLEAGWFWPAIVISGMLGNIAPIARAAYCDVQLKRNQEPNIINTFLVLPLPFIVLSFNLHLFERYSSYFIHFVELVTFLACVFLFTDQRDKSHRDISSHFFKTLLKKFSNGPSIRLLFSFYILNSGWWLLTYLVEAHSSEAKLLNYFFLVIGLSFLAGAIFCRIYSFSPARALPLLTLVIAVLFVFDWLYSVIFGNIAIATSFMHFTLIGGVVLPLWYVFFSQQAKTHEQGTVFGFLESLRSLTELTGPLILIFISINNIYYLLIPQSIVGLLLVLSLKRGKNESV